MVNQKTPNAVQETQGQPPILQTTDDVRAIQHVPSFSARSGCGRDEIPQQSAASRGLAQTFGLDIRAAILTVLVDLMVFTGDTVSFETLLPLGIGVAAVLAFIVYRLQRKSYGDDHADALTKALIVGLLTAIPVPLSPFIAIPGGVIGIVKAIRRR